MHQSMVTMIEVSSAAVERAVAVELSIGFAVPQSVDRLAQETASDVDTTEKAIVKVVADTSALESGQVERTSELAIVRA